jgi:hypothetical protein
MAMPGMRLYQAVENRLFWHRAQCTPALKSSLMDMSTTFAGRGAATCFSSAS